MLKLFLYGCHTAGNYWYSGGMVKNSLVFKGGLCFLYIFMYVYPKYASLHLSPLPASLCAVQLCLGALPSSSAAARTPEIQLAGAWGGAAP